MSLVFLHLPPDHVGCIENDPFRMRFARYPGQAFPIIAPMVGRYFGRKGKRLDKYGMNLSADAKPGRGHQSLHDQLLHMMVSMMKVAGVQANVEAAKFLNDKIGELYISNYINHVTAHPDHRNTPHAIIPDIHAYDFPSGRQMINDSGESTTNNFPS